MEFTQMHRKWFPLTPVNGTTFTPSKVVNCYIIIGDSWYVHTKDGWHTFTPALVTGGAE